MPHQTGLAGPTFRATTHGTYGRYPNAMSDEAHLLTAIADAPDDDTPRLVYADWLDEHNQPERAEFIRLQIGLSAGTIPKAQQEAARTRSEALFGRNQATWWGVLPHHPGVTWHTAPFPFDRGFAHGVDFRHGKAWREHAKDVFAAAPVSRIGCDGTFSARTTRTRIFASPLLGRFAEFRGAQFDIEGARALANNPHLVGRLRTLQISSSSDPNAVAAALGRAPGCGASSRWASARSDPQAHLHWPPRRT